MLQDPLPDTTWIYELDRAQDRHFAARHSDLRIDLPVEPMLGTVGVAPAGGEVRSSLVPDAFGGNMDTPQMRAGATCYLRVNVPGALFSLGDGHYRQGEGEACGTAVEGAMTTTVIVELVKGGGARPGRGSRTTRTGWRSGRPGRSRTPGGSARPSSSRWFGELYGLHAMDAYQLLSRSPRCRSPTSSTPTTAPSSRPARRSCRRRRPTAGCTTTCAPARRPCLQEDPDGPAAQRRARARHRGHPGDRPGDRGGVRSPRGRGGVLRAHRRRRRRATEEALGPSVPRHGGGRRRRRGGADRLGAAAADGWAASTPSSPT